MGKEAVEMPSLTGIACFEGLHQTLVHVRLWSGAAATCVSTGSFDLGFRLCMLFWL